MNKQEISNLTPSFNIKTGLGNVSVKYSPKRLVINYNGNMGSSIIRSVDPILGNLNLPTIESLKSMFDVYKEMGNPEYLYTLELLLTNTLIKND